MGSNSWYFLSRQTKVLGGLILLSRSLSFSLALFVFLFLSSSLFLEQSCCFEHAAKNVLFA